MGDGVTKPPKGTGDGKGPKPPDVIDSDADLKKYIRNFENVSLLSIINQLQKKKLRLSAGYFGELQERLLKQEAKSGVPVSVLSGAEGAGPTIRGALESGTLDTSSNAADRAAANYRAELAAQVDRERIAEDRRKNLLDTARALVEQQMQAKSAAQTQGVTLAGSDPFRFIGQLRGQDIAAGVQTPYDIFKGYLQGQAQQQSPNIGPNSTIADLESALGKLPQAGQQPTAPSFGFEKGGSTGTMGPYEAHLVGEAGSQIAPGTEVMITGASIVPNPGETTILPLGGGMEEGGVLKPGSLGTLPTQFQNLRSKLGGRLGYLPSGTQKEPQFGGGYGALTTPLSQNLKRGYGELVGLGKISQQDADFVTNAIGELPTPRAANQWFKTLSPTELEAVLSLYKLAGVSSDEFNEMLKSALVVGGPRQAVRIAA